VGVTELAELMPRRTFGTNNKVKVNSVCFALLLARPRNCTDNSQEIIKKRRKTTGFGYHLVQLNNDLSVRL
jgi:hypothetical protein